MISLNKQLKLILNMIDIQKLFNENNLMDQFYRERKK